MEKDLLRCIAKQYLVPLFSGARLEDDPAKSPAGQKLVGYDRNQTVIAFKADRSDKYRLLLKRSQNFEKRNGKSVMPEINVVESFVEIVSKMSLVLGSEFKEDILSTFQRRVVARSVGGERMEETVLEGIDRLSLWADRLYEGSPIATAIGYCDNTQGDGSVRLQKMAEEDFGAVLGNGRDTLLEFDFQNRFVSHKSLVAKNEEDSPYCPIQQSLIAGWTAESKKRIAITLNRLGEILVLRNQQLLFAYRSGKWHFLTHNPVVKQMRIPNKPKNIRACMYETCLDASFARTGACIGAVSWEHRNDWRDLVNEEDELDRKKLTKTKAISRMILGRKFHEIDRRLRQELVAIDGATVISHDGKVLAVGAILKIPGGSTSGARLAAATALSEMGLGIKVSQDGGITGHRRGEEVFSVM